MTRAAADSLASTVARAVPIVHVVVLSDDAHWLVQVHTASAGVFTSYDEDDWPWLRHQIIRGHL
jgi:hypothetical protein